MYSKLFIEEIGTINSQNTGSQNKEAQLKMETIVSVDIGNLTTISSLEDKTFICESRIKDWEELDVFNNMPTLVFGDRTYIIGEGNYENNLVKYEKENFLPLLYYAIASVVPKDCESVKLVIGIPAGQFAKQRTFEKEFITSNNFKQFQLNGEERRIHIEDVSVIPESYGLKATGHMDSCKKDLKTLVIDVGGGTTDVAEFDADKNFTNGFSIKMGLLGIYKQTRTVLENQPYSLNISLADAQKYFDGKLSLTSGEIEYKNLILSSFLKQLVNELRGNKDDLKSYNIILCGGGGTKIYEAFRQLFPQTIPVDDITANAKGFYKVGERIWQK